MNKIFVRTIAALLAVTGCASAQRAGDEAWLAVAKEKRPGIIRIVLPSVGGNPDTYAAGFFVSDDGWAIASLLAFSGRSGSPDAYAYDGQKLPKPSIRHIDTKHLIATLKFEHKPQVWFDVPELPMSLGEIVAVIDAKREKPCAIGPLLAKTEIPSLSLRAPFHETVWSIGSGMAVGGECVAGLPVIDRAGTLRGYYHSEHFDRAQVFLYASPADHLASSLRAARDSGKTIPFPLPPELNPFDPSSMDPNFVQARQSMQRRDYDAAIGYIGKAITAHPDSLLLHQLEFDAHNFAGANDLSQLLAATKPPPDGSVVHQAQYFRNLANVRSREGDLEGQAKALRDALQLDPEDGALNFRYAQVALEIGKKDEALLFCRKAAAVSPDNITILDGLRTLLVRDGKWEEADAIATKTFELEELYRRK